MDDVYHVVCFVFLSGRGLGLAKGRHRSVTMYDARYPILRPALKPGDVKTHEVERWSVNTLPLLCPAD